MDRLWPRAVSPLRFVIVIQKDITFGSEREDVRGGVNAPPLGIGKRSAEGNSPLPGFGVTPKRTFGRVGWDQKSMIVYGLGEVDSGSTDCVVISSRCPCVPY